MCGSLPTQEVLALYKTGQYTLVAIGALAGVSKERIRQVVRKAGITGNAYLENLWGNLREEKARAKLEREQKKLARPSFQARAAGLGWCYCCHTAKPLAEMGMDPSYRCLVCCRELQKKVRQTPIRKTAKQMTVIKLAQELPNASQEEIARLTGTMQSYVSAVLKRYKFNQIQEGKA
jgi:hypothetical protein